MADTVEQQIAKARLALQQEMPEAASADIQPMGTTDKIAAWLKQHMPVVGTEQPIGASTRGQSIRYNPANLAGQSQSQIEDMIAHELMHTRQNAGPAQPSPIGGFTYGQDPKELEAYQFEHDRARAQGRTPDIGPSFLPSTMARQTGDIQLPSTRMAAQQKRLLEAELLRRQQAKTD